MYPPQPTRLTSPEGLGTSGREDPVGVSDDRGGDMDNPPMGLFSGLGNTSLMV